MRRQPIFVLALISGALVCASVQAEAKQKTRQPTSQVEADANAAELTVKKKSWLDPGNVVPVGTQNRYMDDFTTYNSAPGGTWRRSEFGDEVLPGPFDLPNFQRNAPW